MILLEIKNRIIKDILRLKFTNALAGYLFLFRSVRCINVLCIVHNFNCCFPFVQFIVIMNVLNNSSVVNNMILRI